LATSADAPLSGVFRVVYFLATGVACLLVVVTAITAFYDPPEGDGGFPGDGNLFGPDSSFEPTTERVDLDEFLDAVTNGEVDYVEVDGTKLTYTLFSGFTRYETEIEEGDTVRGVLSDAGLEPFEFPPIEEQSSSGDEGDNNEREDYNRNVSLIFVATAAGAFAVAIFGLGARFSPLRAGLMLGGLLLFLTGMGYWADSTSEWLGFVSATAILLLLAAGFPSLDDGFPLRAAPHTPPRRLTEEDVTIPREDEPPPPADTT
jgi:hypothetical protein